MLYHLFWGSMDENSQEQITQWESLFKDLDDFSFKQGLLLFATIIWLKTISRVATLQCEWKHITELPRFAEESEGNVQLIHADVADILHNLTCYSGQEYDKEDFLLILWETYEPNI